MIPVLLTKSNNYFNQLKLQNTTSCCFFQSLLFIPGIRTWNELPNKETTKHNKAIKTFLGEFHNIRKQRKCQKRFAMAACNCDEGWGAGDADCSQLSIWKHLVLLSGTLEDSKASRDIVRASSSSSFLVASDRKLADDLRLSIMQAWLAPLHHYELFAPRHGGKNNTSS